MNNNQTLPTLILPCETKTYIDDDGIMRKLYSCETYHRITGQPGYCFTILGSDLVATPICQPCTMGNYCPWGPSSYVPGVQYTSDPEIMCPESYFCPTVSKKYKCLPGFYCPSGSSFPVPCSKQLPPQLASYITDFDTDYDTSGLMCLAGSEAPVNCPAGYYCPTPEKSIKCTPGYRCPFMNTVPVKCSSLAYCPSGSVIPAFHAVILASVFIIGATLLLTTYLSRWKTRSQRFFVSAPTSDRRVPVPLEISFENLKMNLKSEPDKCIINGISGVFSPGTLTAILGGSGAGKSSLLAALASLTPYANVSTDSLRLNGCEATLLDCKKISSFVAQSDILFTHLSVYENLYFCAKTRLPKGTTKTEIDAIIDATLESLDLLPMKHQLVGSEAKRSLSGGQVKRVSIAMALVAKPTLLLADEITSGLSSNDALLLISMLKKLSVQLGLTVIIVLHQPRFAIFEQFDQALVLQATPSGAKLVYSGNPGDLPTYMNDLGVYRDENDNPADRFIDCVSSSAQEDPYRLPSFYESRLRPIIRQESCENLAEASIAIAAKLEYPEPTSSYDLNLTRRVPRWYVQIAQYVLILLRHDFARSTFIFAVELTVYAIASIIISQLATAMVDELAMRIKIQSAVSLVYSVLCAISGTLVRSRNILMVQRIINDGFNRVHEITGLLLYNFLISGIVRVLCFFSTYQAILLPYFSMKAFLIFWIQYSRMSIIGIIVSTFIRDSASASLLSGFLGIVDGFIFTGPLMIIEGPFLLFLSRATGGGFLGTEIIYWIMREDSSLAGFEAYGERVFWQTGIPVPDKDSDMLTKGLIDLTCSFVALLAIVISIYLLKRYLEVRVSYKAKVRATITTGLLLLGKTAATIIECGDYHLTWNTPDLSIYKNTLLNSTAVKLPSKNFTLPICDNDSINFFGNNTYVTLLLPSLAQSINKHNYGYLAATKFNNTVYLMGPRGLFTYNQGVFTQLNRLSYPFPAHAYHNSTHLFAASKAENYTIITEINQDRFYNVTYDPLLPRDGSKHFWEYKSLYNPNLVTKVGDLIISTPLTLPNPFWKTEGIYKKLLVHNTSHIYSLDLPDCGFNEAMSLTTQGASCIPCNGSNYFKHSGCISCDIGQEVGWYNEEIQCLPCKASMYNPVPGNTFNSCLPCSHDMVSTDDFSSCVYCKDSTLTVVNYHCSSCPVGYIMSDNKCTMCPEGSYSSGDICIDAKAGKVAFADIEVDCPKGYYCENGKLAKYCDPTKNLITKAGGCKNCGFLYSPAVRGGYCVRKESFNSIIVLGSIIFIAVLTALVVVYSFYDIYIVKRLYTNPQVYILEWGKYHIAAAIFISIMLAFTLAGVFIFNRLSHSSSENVEEFDSKFMDWARYNATYESYVTDEDMRNITLNHQISLLNGSVSYFDEPALSLLFLEDYFPYWDADNTSYSYSGDYLAAWTYPSQPLSFEGEYDTFWTTLRFSETYMSYIPVLLKYDGNVVMVNEIITTFHDIFTPAMPSVLIVNYTVVNATTKIRTPRIHMLHPKDPRVYGLNRVLPFQPSDLEFESCVARNNNPPKAVFNNFINAWKSYRSAGIFKVCEDVFWFLSLCVVGVIIAFDSKFAIAFNCYHFFKGKRISKPEREIPEVQE